MTAHGTVIVGACQAGLQIAQSLREAGYDDPISLIGAEAHLPYQRPPLSKAFLKGGADITTLTFRNPDFYTTQRIELFTGTRVTAVDRVGRFVTTDTGRQYRYDHLALTTGARVRSLPIAGADLDGVLKLRGADDAIVLKQRLDAANEVVVIGGGFIGLEVAATGVLLGKTVTVLEAAPRLMARAVAPAVSAFFADAHRMRGMDVRLGASVAAIEGKDGKVTGVRLGDGGFVPADLVVVGVGVDSRTELAEAAGLAVDRGIVVDEYGQTSASDIVAAGDCTVHPHAANGGMLIRIESVQNAIDQAKAAAGTIIGRPLPHNAVPWFWSDQADLKLQTAGLSAAGDEVHLRGDPASARFSALYFRAGRLVAADSINSPGDHMAARRLIAMQAAHPIAEYLDPSVPLKSLLG